MGSIYDYEFSLRIECNGNPVKESHHIPTPKQIADGCREIQRGWSADDRRLMDRSPMVETVVVNVPRGMPVPEIAWF